MKKIFISLLIIYSLLLMACPKKTAVRQAAEASYRLAGLTSDAMDKTIEAYRDDVISLDTKDKLIGGLLKVARSGAEFNALVKELQAQYGDKMESVPAGDVRRLDLFFSEKIITPFFEVLVVFGALSPEQKDKILAVISAIRLVILQISNGFGGGSVSLDAVQKGGLVYAE